MAALADKREGRALQASEVGHATGEAGEGAVIACAAVGGGGSVEGARAWAAQPRCDGRVVGARGWGSGWGGCAQEARQHRRGSGRSSVAEWPGRRWSCGQRAWRGRRLGETALAGEATPRGGDALEHGARALWRCLADGSARSFAGPIFKPLDFPIFKPHHVDFLYKSCRTQTKARHPRTRFVSVPIPFHPTPPLAPTHVAGATAVAAGWGAIPRVCGYDPQEHEAYEVCRRSSGTPPSRLTCAPSASWTSTPWGSIGGRGPTESTEFSFTRFLTPYLASYRGWALFIDCDFLYLADVAGLLAAAAPPGADADRLAVACVKHVYEPAGATKMDGAIQTMYLHKNWSSMVLYNYAHPKNVAALTPDTVSTQTGVFLHRFAWLDNDEIGEVPFVWNFLVDHNRVDPADPATHTRAIHYTCGGPWFERYRDCEFADLCIKEAEELKAEKDKLKAEEKLKLSSRTRMPRRKTTTRRIDRSIGW
uniref:Uncharacterized protein n=1 Tax=Setaria viridis TaxID=4556 RepID=A0A4U6SWK7_SETVI|nr:hypothetical protein SEVIR_9G191500v2 [Setaria viridis]